ncbi:MAG TPA: porin family protein [Chitinophagaceae bacterium]|nr:porin family protein [Chitinophagaceae bacterium]
MRPLLFSWLVLGSLSLGAQGIGIKAGLNFANVTNASSLTSSNRTGFMAGLFLAPPSKKILSSRTELIFSRQGYNFQTGSNTGHVNLDYLILPQLMGINITHFVQVQLGAQMALLLNAKADSAQGNGPPNTPGSVMSYYNRFDYGFGAGVEIHPVLGLLIGARYNISLGKLYKDLATGQPPSFSSADARNNVVQLFAGWTFGQSSSKKKTQ